jgi:hypothetical protein
MSITQCNLLADLLHVFHECLFMNIRETRIPEITIFFHGTTALSGPRPPHYRGFTITLRHTTLGRTPLDILSQRPLPDNTQHSQRTVIHANGGIRTNNPSKRVAVDTRLRPHSHWDRPKNNTLTPNQTKKDNQTSKYFYDTRRCLWRQQAAHEVHVFTDGSSLNGQLLHVVLKVTPITTSLSNRGNIPEEMSLQHRRYEKP